MHVTPREDTTFGVERHSVVGAAGNVDEIRRFHLSDVVFCLFHITCNLSRRLLRLTNEFVGGNQELAVAIMTCNPKGTLLLYRNTMYVTNFHMVSLWGRQAKSPLTQDRFSRSRVNRSNTKICLNNVPCYKASHTTKSYSLKANITRLTELAVFGVAERVEVPFEIQNNAEVSATHHFDDRRTTVPDLK